MVSMEALTQKLQNLHIRSLRPKKKTIIDIPLELHLLIFNKLTLKDQISFAATSRYFFTVYQANFYKNALVYCVMLRELQKDSPQDQFEYEKTLKHLEANPLSLQTRKDTYSSYLSKLFRAVFSRYLLAKRHAEPLVLPSFLIKLTNPLCSEYEPLSIKTLSQQCCMKSWNLLIHPQGSACCYFSLFLNSTFGREFLFNALPSLKQQHRGKVAIALSARVSQAGEQKFLIDQLFRGVLTVQDTYLSLTTLCKSPLTSPELIEKIAQSTIQLERNPSRNTHYHHFIFNLSKVNNITKDTYELLFDRASDLLPFQRIHLLINIACQPKTPTELKLRILRRATHWATSSQIYFYKEFVHSRGTSLPMKIIAKTWLKTTLAV